jgi:hypothetical protein
VVIRAPRPCSPAEVTRIIEAWGYTVAGAKPNKAVADAMAYEVERGWLRRVRRGRYQMGRFSTSSRRRILALFP